jgi:hypothetical protein
MLHNEKCIMHTADFSDKSKTLFVWPFEGDLKSVRIGVLLGWSSGGLSPKNINPNIAINLQKWRHLVHLSILCSSRRQQQISSFYLPSISVQCSSMQCHSNINNNDKTP